MRRTLNFEYRTEQVFTWDEIFTAMTDLRTRFGDAKKYAVTNVVIQPGSVVASITLVEPDEAGINTFFGDILKRWNQWTGKKK